MTLGEHRLTRPQWLLWFSLGVAVSIALLALESHALGGWEAIPRVNDQAAVRPFIESEMGSFQATPRGHDGQFFLAMALDPYGLKGVGSTFDHGGYRYRRIVYPLVAGGFGLLHGRAVLVGLMLVAAFGVGLGTASVAELAKMFGVRPWVTLGVLANPGVWMSVELLTSEALALGLSLIGVAFWLKRLRAWSIVALTLAVLTKEQYVLVPLAIAAWAWFRHDRRHATLGALVPTLSLALWSGWVEMRFGGGYAVQGNLVPLGILDSTRLWTTISSTEQALIGLTLIALLLAAVAPIRASSLLRWLTWPWVLLALVSASFVWNLGNNAARVFTPLWVFGLLSAGSTTKHPTPSVPAAERSRPLR